MSTTKPRAQTGRSMRTISDELVRDALLRQHRHSLFALVMMMLLCHISILAQPSAAINLYNRANRESARGNLDKALNDYTRALESSQIRIDQKDSQDHFSDSLNRLDSSIEDGTQITANDT